MTYQETVNYLFSQLPMYQREGKAAYKADLSNTLALCKKLDNPEKRFKSIHIAGTNGKGSTSHFIASILQEAGYKVGLYTSPHLLDFRERIKVNGKLVPKQTVVDFVSAKGDLLSEISPSFFEWTVGLAFNYFAQEEVDIAVIETGLGGRLDSTNVITPLVSVITNIGLDHTQFLGNTLVEIAGEKAGIIKEEIPVVIGETQEEIASVFMEKAQCLNSEILFADQQSKIIDIPNLISYQRKNVQTAVIAAKELRAFGFDISNNHLVSGVEYMIRNTGLRGRWEIIQNKPTVVTDTAHNKEGLQYTMKHLQNVCKGEMRIVFGMVNDKNADSLMELLPDSAQYYLCEPEIARAKPIAELAAVFKNMNKNKKSFNKVSEAVKAAISDSQEDDIVYIGGSTFVVADALNYFN